MDKEDNAQLREKHRCSKRKRYLRQMTYSKSHGTKGSMYGGGRISIRRRRKAQNHQLRHQKNNGVHKLKEDPDAYTVPKINRNNSYIDYPQMGDVPVPPNHPVTIKSYRLVRHLDTHYPKDIPTQKVKPRKNQLFITPMYIPLSTFEKSS